MCTLAFIASFFLWYEAFSISMVVNHLYFNRSQTKSKKRNSMFLPLSVMVKGMNLSDERCGSLAREPVVSLETRFWSLFIRMGSGHFLKGQMLPLFLFPSWSLLGG